MKRKKAFLIISVIETGFVLCCCFALYIFTDASVAGVAKLFIFSCFSYFILSVFLLCIKKCSFGSQYCDVSLYVSAAGVIALAAAVWKDAELLGALMLASGLFSASIFNALCNR